MLSYQIRRIGKAVGDVAYSTLEEACAQWAEMSEAYEVVLVEDGAAKLVYTPQECHAAAKRAIPRKFKFVP